MASPLYGYVNGSLSKRLLQMQAHKLYICNSSHRCATFYATTSWNIARTNLRKYCNGKAFLVVELLNFYALR